MKDKVLWLVLLAMSIAILIFLLVRVNITPPKVQAFQHTVVQQPDCPDGYEEVSVWDEKDCVPDTTPTPTDEVTPTPTEEVPTPSETPHTDSSVPSQGQQNNDCADVKPPKVANITVRQTGTKGELEVQWSLALNADSVHIVYGLNKEAQYSLLNTPNDGSEVIRDLQSNQHYWFSVAGTVGCAVGEYSDWYDPLVP